MMDLSGPIGPVGLKICFLFLLMFYVFFKMPRPRREGDSQKKIALFLRRASFRWTSVILCGGPLCAPLWTHRTLGSQEPLWWTCVGLCGPTGPLDLKMGFAFCFQDFFKMSYLRREGDRQTNSVLFFLGRASFLCLPQRSSVSFTPN